MGAVIIQGIEHQMSMYGGLETDLHIRLYGDAGLDYDLGSSLDGLFSPTKVIVKCQYCDQWGARKCVCKHCGGSIE